MSNSVSYSVSYSVIGSLACFWLLGGCSPSAPPDRATSGASAEADPRGDRAQAPPRLVVQIIIDQWPTWIFERDRGHFDGGLARLLRAGVTFSRVELPYAVSDTGPGHASIGTGAPPAVHHILANSWWDVASRSQLGSVTDERAPVFGVLDPEYQGGGRSGGKLAVEGVADALRTHTNGAGKSVSISIKDRSALFAIGRKPDLAIWYDRGQPAMTTSAYYRQQTPPWLVELARTHPIPARLKRVWSRLPDIDHGAITGRADKNPGERGRFDLGNEFPVELAASSDPARALVATPLADELVLETALAAIAGEQLGADETPDLLSLSFSGHDYAAHYWGQESWERLDMILRLDDALADFFEHLDAAVGAGRYAVVVTSDHGGTPLVEISRAAGQIARRIDKAEVAEVAEKAAASVLGAGDWVTTTTASSVYVSPAFAALPANARERGMTAMVSAIRSMEGIGYAERTERIAGDCRRFSGNDFLACNSVAPKLSGQIFISAAAGSYVTSTYIDFGSNHGSMSVKNRTVPVLVYAPSWPSARAGTTVDSARSFLQIAPTVAALLGVPAPEAATESALAPPTNP